MVWKHRYTVLAILFCTYLLCYVDRMVMATAIPFIARDFQLSLVAMGGVMSAFFVGYALMQIPGGLMADRFGPRVVLTSGVLWWSVMTALTGMASNLATLVAVRLFFGLGEGPYPAAASKAISLWFPLREVGRANGLQLAASAIGVSVAPLLVTILIAHWGWREMFYVLFFPGLILGFFLWRYVGNSPASSRHVSQQELAEYEKIEISPVPPLRTILRQSLQTPVLLWCSACLLFANMISWGLLSWLPTYLLQARGFSIERMGVFAGVTGLAYAVGVPLGGYLCDRFFKHRLKIQILIGLGGSAITTFLAAIAPTGEWAVACFVPAFLFIGISGAAIFTLPLIVMPKQAVGVAFGLVNTAGQLAGVLAPLLIGWILSTTGGNFQTVLLSLVGFCLLAMIPACQIRQIDPLPASLEPAAGPG